jgi:SAM-dependent methyltransferase
MIPAPDPLQLYSERIDSYLRFIRFVRYPEAIRAYFLRSRHLGSGLRVLDAGCGTGIVTLALREALLRRGLTPGSFHAFDLTPRMLERFRSALRRGGIPGIELQQADVLELDRIPSSWSDYDLVVSASMLEYLPRRRLGDGLRGLRSRMREDGRLVVFITRRNWMTRPLIGRWWQANLYEKRELEEAFRSAGFEEVAFGRFPAAFRHLALWGHIVEARG